VDLADEILSRARDQASQARPLPPSETEVEALRAEVLDHLALLPEPPAYKRAGDPSRAQAQARLDSAETLTRRALVLQRAAQGMPLAASTAAIAAHMETQVRLLVAIFQGKLLEAEAAGEKAARTARAIHELFAAFQRVEGQAAPVFDRKTGASRFDPHEGDRIEVTLPCPQPTCRRPALYALSPRSPTHRFTCTTCKQPFLGYFGEVKAVDQQKTARGVRYALRIEEVGGAERPVEFEDLSGGHLPVAPRDLVALLYLQDNRLAAVENLSTSRVLWVRLREGCFLATAAYGDGAPQLAAFRTFRDRALLPHAWGRLAVAVYYEVGPLLARPVAKAPPLRAALRAGLERLRPHLERGWP
jgi:hypothetical protein